jgi:ACS family sodium-dependent inorganic phosphate cotransporter
MNSVFDAPASGRAGWQRRYTIIALCACASLICYIDRVNISVAAIAMQEDYGWSETTKGLVLSSFFVGYMLFMTPSGWLANRIGGKIVLGAAVVWWSLFTILTPLAAMVSLPLLIATRIAMGLGEAAMYPAAYNIFSRWVPPQERSRALALLIGGIPLGTLLALTTTGWFDRALGLAVGVLPLRATGVLWCIVWFARAHNDPALDPRISAAERKVLARHAPPPRHAEPVPGVCCCAVVRCGLC